MGDSSAEIADRWLEPLFDIFHFKGLTNKYTYFENPKNPSRINLFFNKPP